MPQQATETPTANIQSILDPLPVDRSVKADAWDAWHNAKTSQEFQASFDKINIPREAKAALWDAKFDTRFAAKPRIETQRELNHIPAGAPKAEVYTPRSIARGAVLGAFEGVGIKPSTNPIDVVTGSVKQFGEGLKDLAVTSWEHNKHDVGMKFLPEWARDIATAPAAAIDILPTFIDRAATSIERGFRDAAAAGKRGDSEAAAEATASTLAQIALLRKVKDSAEVLEDAKKASLADKTQGVARKLTEARQATRDAVVKAIKQCSDDLEKNKADRRATMEGNMLRHREALTKIDREKLAIGEENRGIEAQNKAQSEAVAKRGQMAKQVDTESLALGTELKELESSVYQEANRRFDAVRQKIGNPESAPDALIRTVKSAESDILQNIPENVKEFRRILSMGDSDEIAKLRQEVMTGQGMTGKYEELSPERKTLVDSMVDRWGGQIEESEPLTWGKLQSLKSRIDKRLRDARGMNGDVKRALFAVRDGVVDEMGNMAQSQGATGDWDAARSFYRQWREDFHEPRGPSGSGSPVAQAMDAVDPSKIRQPFARSQSTLGNRGTAILERYKQFDGGKIAKRVQSMLTAETEMERLPKQVKPKPLKQASEVHELPTRKSGPPAPGKPAVDVRAASLKAVEDTARRIGRLNAWDARIVASSVVAVPVSLFLQSHIGVEAAGVGLGYVVTKYLLSNALEKPEIANWIAYTPKSEIDALSKLPGREKIIVQAGITELAQQVSEGKKISASRYLRSFLGPNNINRLVRAGIVAEPREKKPAEQIRDLRAILRRHSSNPNMPAGEAP